MQQVFLHADFVLAAPVERVWDVLGDFTNARAARGFVTAIRGHSGGVGSIRLLEIDPAFGGGELFEMETARDDEGRYCAYTLVGKVDLPIADYYGSIHAVPIDARSTRLIWANRYRAPAELATDLRERSLAILAIIETNLRAELEAVAA